MFNLTNIVSIAESVDGKERYCNRVERAQPALSPQSPCQALERERPYALGNTLKLNSTATTKALMMEPR